MGSRKRPVRTEGGGPPEEPEAWEPEAPQPGPEPIEPEAGGRRKPVLRWTLFLVFVLWAVLTAYHEPILTRIGGYLVVSHELEDADLIVCLSGGQVERGLAAADLYEKGLAPRVLVSPEIPPDGYEALERAGIEIPRSVDVLRRILEESGVPGRSIVEGEQPARSTMGEARTAIDLAGEKGYRSLIVVTSPTHTRRAWMTFRHAAGGNGITIRMAPSSYSGFRAEDWWKTRRYVREVIVEYQKLLYYTLEYFL